MSDCRKMASEMNLWVRQFAAESIRGAALIERMAGHLPALNIIWSSTTDEQLAALCREYPDFHKFARLMEAAAEVERQKPTRSYDGVLELPDPLNQQLSSLLSDAAKIETGYQSALDAVLVASRRSRMRVLLLPVADQNESRPVLRVAQGRIMTANQ